MNRPDFFVDIHFHSTLRAYNTFANGKEKNIWKKTHNPKFETKTGRWASMKMKDLATASQSNLESVAEGGVRVAFDSLYPVEKGFLNIRKITQMMLGKRGSDEVLMSASGINQMMLHLLRNQTDYFKELQDQYEFLSGQQGGSPDGRFTFHLVRDFDEIEQITAEDPNALAIVVTIEGAHAFGLGTANAMAMRKDGLRQLMADRIAMVKAWDHPPFFINLAHHFWNQLCGHSRSFKPGINKAFQQKPGMNLGMTDLGWMALEGLLSRKNGRRILIDIKHMSVQARSEYYRFVERYNYLNAHDRIPIICSHTGVNGFESMEESMQKRDKGSKMKGSYFHNWGINLSNEEIRTIHHSGGLIGIMLDKGLLGSAETLNRIESITDEEKQRDAWVELILKNIFQVPRAVGKRSAWDTVCLGSDFDGVISYIDIYPDASYLPQMYDDMISYMRRTSFGKDIWFGYTPEQILSKVMKTNAMEFLRQHFRDESIWVPSVQAG